MRVICGAAWGATLAQLPLALQSDVFDSGDAIDLFEAFVDPVLVHPPEAVDQPWQGVCMLSREAVFAQSKVGQSASDRLKMLAAQQQSLLDVQRKPLAAEVQAFQQKAATLPEAQRQQQGQALLVRMQGYQAQVNQLDERIQLTRGKVMQQIGYQAQPIAASSYAGHHCGLLLNRCRKC